MSSFRPYRIRHRLMSEINVVPYIDITLVLLVIFMITAPLMNQGVKVKLPYAEAKALPSEQKPIIISVNARGEYFLNISNRPNVPLKPVEMVDKVKKILLNNNTRAVLIKGDREAAYGEVVKAMAFLQQAGVQQVGLMTQDIK